MKLVFIFFPIPLPSYIFGVGYILYSIYGMKKDNDNIGHTAHLGRCNFRNFNNYSDRTFNNRKSNLVSCSLNFSFFIFV
jgi:hypothetical protein